MESGRLEEEKLLVWNRLPGYNFVLVLFFILIIVILCHVSLLCLKMAPGGLKLVAANETSSSQERVWFLVLKGILPFKSELPKLDIETQGIKKEGFSISLDWNLHRLQIIPYPGLLVSFGSLWRIGMMRMKTLKIMMKIRNVLIWS